MGNLLCMGLFLEFAGVPTPRLTGCGDHADHRLAARMDVDVFDRDLLLTLAAVAIERIKQDRIGAGKPVRLAQVLTVSISAEARPGISAQLRPTTMVE